VTEDAAGRPRRTPKQEQQPASTEITEVGPGILRMQIPIFFTGLGHVNCYAMTDDRGAAVIDAGMPGRATWQALSARLSDAGLKVGDIHTVLVTHSHPDHFGNAGRLAHEAGAELVTERRFHTWLEPKALRTRERPSAASRPPDHRADDHGRDDHSRDGHGADDHGRDDHGRDDHGADDHSRDDHSGHAHRGHDHGHAHSGGPDPCAELLTPATGDEGAGEAPVDAGADGDDTGYFSMASRTTPWGGSPIPHLRRNVWMMRLARWHLLPFMRPPVPTRHVTGGDHIDLAGREWEVVCTPGHTGDHVCLFDPASKILISGDHVLPTITPHVPGLSPLADPLGSYLESLEGLRRLGEVSLVLPAHGHPFTDLPGRIDQIVAHHEDRLLQLQRIGAALGQATVVDLSRELFRRAVWGMMAESETYAHLEYLRLRGKAQRLEIDGQAAYRLEAPESPPGPAATAAPATPLPTARPPDAASA